MENLLNSVALVALLTTFLSCGDKSDEVKSDTVLIKGDELLIPSTAILLNEKPLRSAISEVNEAEDFAKLLATSIGDKDLRKFLKDEANKKTDGDFDILVSQVLSSKIGGTSFSEKVKQGSVDGAFIGIEVFSNAIKNNKLNISIPLLIDKWDDSKQQPLVALAIGAKENETKYLRAFDSKGRVYLLDANLEPNVPVIVVGNNERMNYESENKSSKSLRTSGNYERITYLKCPNLGAIEPWHQGGPEFRFDGVVYNNGSSAAFQAFTNMEYPPSREHVREGYTLALWNRRQDLFIWNFDLNHGPDYYIQAWEIDDNGATYKLTVGVTVGQKEVATGTASFELTYRAQDKKLKGQLIHYTNPSSMWVGDGTIEFLLQN